MFAIILGLLLTILGMGNGQASDAIVIPPKPDYAPTVSQWDAMEWAQFEADAYWEYSDAFTALFNSYDGKTLVAARSEFTNLFNSYETKRASNGRLMIRTGNTGSFKFAKKGM